MDSLYCFSCGAKIPNSSSWFNCKCGLSYSSNYPNSAMIFWTDSLNPSGGIVQVPIQELLPIKDSLII